MNDSFTVWGDARSGNCYKVALTLSLLDQPFQWVETSVLDGTTRSDAFLALNPNGKVPILRRPDGKLLAESNAILLHLAEGSPLLPADNWSRAQCYQWLFFEQYSHEPYIAVARFLAVYDHGQAADPAREAMLVERGNRALGIMDEVLGDRPWFAGQTFSIADIALFAYTHVAGDGGFQLEDYPAVLAWLERVRTVPGHFDLEAFRP